MQYFFCIVREIFYLLSVTEKYIDLKDDLNMVDHQRYVIKAFRITGDQRIESRASAALDIIPGKKIL